MGSGKMGYGAVVTQMFCGDKSSSMTSSTPEERGTSTIESCYDLDVYDSMGDGLTSPWAAQGGLAGGFSFSIDGEVVVEHRGMACPTGDTDEWEDCAIQNGFDYCGVRVCTVNDNGEFKATMNTLSGSQCSLSLPQCDAESRFASSQSSIKVNVATDSFADELSWDLRKSSKTDSKSMDQGVNNDLLLSGGGQVYEEGSKTEVKLGQRGVGVPLGDNDMYLSKACLPDDQTDDTCYDFRAYDTYGDGMGCGADGSLSITLQTEDGTLNLEQEDTNIAKRQQVNGQMQMACMGRKKLSKWSFCAVRICSDGEVFGLEGNQCDFGLGDALIDEAFLGLDPFSVVNMRPQGSDVDMTPQNSDVTKPEKEEVEVITVDLDDLGLDVIFFAEDEIAEIVPADQTWAEYYEELGPGFTLETLNASLQPNNDEVSPTQAKPNQQGNTNFQGQKGPRPDSGKLNTNQGQQDNTNFQAVKGPRPDSGKLDTNQGQQDNTSFQAQKGPRPNSGKLNPKPQNEQFNFQSANGNQQQERTAPLKPFSTDLLSVQFPYPLEHQRANQMSYEVSEYLVTYFADMNSRNGRLLEGEAMTPIRFDLDCTKDQKNVGQEKRWVMSCDGDAVFRTSSSATLPTKKDMNKVIRDAFLGEPKEQFLEKMYDHDGKKKKNQTKEEKLKAREEKLQQKQAEKSKLQQKQEVLNIDQVGMDNKKQTKLEKKQMKMDKLEAKREKLQLKQQEQQGENTMGYVSGSMSEMSDSDKGFAIIGGDIHVFVKDRAGGDKVYGDKKGGRRHTRMLRSSGLNGSESRS